MTNAELVARKLAVIDEHLRRLRERRPAGLEAFRQDLLVQDAMAMSILVTAQEAADVALHIASEGAERFEAGDFPPLRGACRERERGWICRTRTYPSPSGVDADGERAREPQPVVLGGRGRTYSS